VPKIKSHILSLFGRKRREIKKRTANWVIDLMLIDMIIGTFEHSFVSNNMATFHLVFHNKRKNVDQFS